MSQNKRQDQQKEWPGQTGDEPPIDAHKDKRCLWWRLSLTLVGETETEGAVHSDCLWSLPVQRACRHWPKAPSLPQHAAPFGLDARGLDACSIRGRCSLFLAVRNWRVDRAATTPGGHNQRHRWHGSSDAVSRGVTQCVESVQSMGVLMDASMGASMVCQWCRQVCDVWACRLVPHRHIATSPHHITLSHAWPQFCFIVYFLCSRVNYLRDAPLSL